MGNIKEELKRYTDTLADSINVQDKTLPVALQLEKILALHNEVGYQVSRLCDMGMTPENAATHFGYVANAQYLLKQFLIPVTNLYESIMEEVSK